jgi:hypothetical protein
MYRRQKITLGELDRRSSYGIEVAPLWHPTQVAA